MKRSFNHHSPFIFMVLLLSIISLAVSCSFGILPAFNQDRNSTQVSITLGSPVSAHAGDNGRAIIRGNGYLYIQTELAAANAVLHGPYQFSAGKTLTVSDIPAGTYANLLVIVVPAVPVAFSAVVSSDSTLVGVRSALLASLSAQTGILSSSSFGLVPNVTIIAGSTNQISATLVPATALAPDASGNVNLGGKAGEVNRFFVSLPNLKASFGGAQPSATTLLGCTVINASASAATISAFGLYDVTGKQLSLDTTESQLAVGGSDPYSAAWAGDDQLYLYIEFTGDSIQLNCTTSIKASTHTITYLANDGTGANIIRTLIDGSTGLLEKNTFTQTGYTFLGWTTIPGSTIVQFADGASYTMPGSDVTFYAVWKISSTPVSRTLSYDASGGTGTMVSRSVAEGTSLSLDMNSFTRVGYTFLGWSSIAGSTTIQYGNGALLSMPGSDLTLYAVWQANTTGANRIIGYDPNGGTGSMTSRTIAEGTTISLDANIFTRTGFGFLGWTTIPAGTTVQYSDSASYTVGSTNQIFYAVWAPKTHNVSFIANGGINTMPNQTIQEGISAALNTHTFSRAGYAFLGWATSSGATTPTYTEGGSFIMGNSDVTLYAVWNQNATHTISYDANGGTGTIPSQTNAEGMSVSLSANAFTRSGYTFLGWATSNTATLAQYAPGSTYTVGSINITFYAVWQSTVTVITHTITYNVNGGTGSMAAKTVNEGSAVSLDANLFTRSGYTFVGWNISAGSGTVLYGDGASYTMGTADVTLFAVWVAYRTISYDTNGGNGTMGSLTAADGDLITLGPNTFTRNGYSFLGWTSIPAGATVQYSDGASFTVGLTNQIFYAVWAPKTHNVSFIANGGINTMPNQTIQEGISAALNTHTFSRAGYAFLGWATSSGATTAAYLDGTSYMMGISDVTLYAVWNLIPTHTISYDPNGGTGSIASQTFAEGMSVSLSANAFTRSGYTFLGWATSNTATLAQYAPGSTYTVGSINITFYAVWQSTVTVITHTITYNVNGGTGSMAAKTVNEGSAVSLDANLFTRSGYTFVGWNISAGSGTVLYGDGASYTMGTADVTLYAVWAAYRTISYDTNGGNGTMGSLTAADGDLITLGPNTFTRSGYSFLGWTSIPAGATVQYSDGASYTVGSANQIFYAVWAIKTHDVYFNANGGINTMPNQTIQEGLSAALNTHTFSLAGHTFLGWSTNSSATTPTYFEGGSFIMGISDVTLYAVWNIIATHTISYDPNGGNGTMASLTAADGSSITLGPNTFARTGYGFLGWTTIPAGVTVQYSDGASYTLGSMNQIFYAVWAPKTHDVYFNANGGINTMPNQTIQEGSSVGLNTHIFTRAGYTFLGWATSSGATTAAYPDGSFLTMGISDVTLYAIWSDVSPAVLTSTSINAESIYAGSTTVSLETHYSVDGSGIQQINLNGDIASLSSATVLINGSPVPVTPAGNNLMLTTVNTQPGSSITVDGIVLTSLEGTKSLSISLTDASGHTSNTVSDSIILDTANPSVTAVLLKNTATGNQNYTNTTAVDLCFTLGTDASGITSLRIDGSNFAGFSSPTVQVNGTTVGSSCIPWTITLDTALTSGGLIRISGISVDPGDGLKNIMVFATDASGKFSSGSANIALDTLPPPIPSVTVVSGAYPNGPVTNGNTEYIGPSATFTLYSSGSSNFKVNSTLLGSTMLTLTDSTSQTVVAVDAAGNMSTPFTFNVTQDSMPPLITSVDIEPSTGNLTVNFDNVGGPFGVLPSYVVEESGNSSSNNGYIGAGYSPFTSGPMTSSASTLSISGLAGLVSVYYDYVKIILTDAVGNQSAPYYVERCFTGTYTITATSP